MKEHIHNFELEQLRARRSRIEELIPMQTNADLRMLLQAEMHYVCTMIEVKERNGGLSGLVTEAI